MRLLLGAPVLCLLASRHAALAFQISIFPSVVTVGVPVVASYTQDTDPPATEIRLIMISPTARSSKFPDVPVVSGVGTAIFTVKGAGMYRVIGRGPNKPTYGQTPQFPVVVMGETLPETSSNSTSTETESGSEAPANPTTSEQLLTTSDSSSIISPTPSSPVASPSYSELSHEPTATTSANNPIHPGVVAGITLGAVAVLVGGLLLLVRHRKRRIQPQKSSPSINPFSPTPSTRGRPAASQRVMHHEDSGWRPTDSSDEGIDALPVLELPPTYHDSTRRVDRVEGGRPRMIEVTAPRSLPSPPGAQSTTEVAKS